MYLAEAIPVPWRLLNISEQVLLWLPRPAPAFEVLASINEQPILRVLAMGDVSLIYTVAHYGTTPFGAFLPLFDEIDIVTGNLETPVTARVEAAGHIGSFGKSNPGSVGILKDVGVDVVNLANNHVLDFGPNGLLDTIAALHAEGIKTCGTAGAAVESDLTVHQANGVKAGFLGFCDDHCSITIEAGAPHPRMAVEDEMRSAIAAARELVDIIVVHLHWGYEFSLHPLGTHRDIARRLVEAGAGLVVCHHAHVPMGIESWKHGVIAYGLGNTLMPMSQYMREGHPWTSRSFMLQVDFASDGIAAVRLDPFVIAHDGRLHRLAGYAGIHLAKSIARLSRRLRDDEFLYELEATRMAYQMVLLIDALEHAAEMSAQHLRERIQSISLLRQRRLLAKFEKIDGLSVAVDGLRELAARTDDLPALSRNYSAIRPLLHSIRQAGIERYRWSDALRSRVP